MFADWAPVGVYTEHTGTFDPAPVFVQDRRMREHIDIIADFHTPETMEMIRRLSLLLILACVALPAFADGGSVAGRVTATTDGKIEPLVGAVVLVQGTVRGTTTNLNGEYRIPIPPGVHTMVFSLVGYQR